MRRGLAFAVSVAWLWAVSGCSPSVDFERMREQARADPYSASALFADGRAMRGLPPGAVALDVGAASTPNPARGREQFDIYCAVCHGPGGSGESVMAKNLSGSPLSLLQGAATQLTANELFESMSRGKAHMAGFDWAIVEADRRAIVLYIQALQQRAPAASATQGQ